MRLKNSYLSDIWRKNKGLFLATLLCAAVRSVILLMPSYLLQYIYENAIQQHDFELLIKLCAVSVIIPVMTGGLIVLDMNINGYILKYFIVVRDELFENMIYRDYSEFAQLNSGSAIYKIIIKTDKVANYYYFGIGNIIWFTTTILVGIFLCWMENHLVAAGIAGVSFLKIMVARGINRRIKYYTDRVNQLSEKQCSFIDDIVSNYIFIKSSGIEEGIYKTYESVFEDRMSEIKRIEAYKVLAGVWQCFCTIILNMLLYLVGGVLIIQGRISIGVLLSVVSIVAWITPTFEGYLDVLLQFAQNKSDEEIIDTFWSDKKAVMIDDRDKAEPSGYDIAFRGTAYRYPEASRDILKDISLEIKENERICFIGRSGCGKSTAIDLISGLLFPTGGSLQIGQIASERIGNEWRRRNVAIASQSGYLFGGTAAENILWGNPEKTTEELQKILELVCLDEWTKRQEKGIDTYIDENSISGGEKQRILLARLLCHKAKIYIFDEATSALDESTEKRVISNLCRHLDSATLIFITHRKNVMDVVERVYSFERKDWNLSRGEKHG